MTTDDKKLLQDIGRLMAKKTYAKKVGNEFVAKQFQDQINDKLREAERRGLTCG